MLACDEDKCHQKQAGYTGVSHSPQGNPLAPDSEHEKKGLLLMYKNKNVTSVLDRLEFKSLLCHWLLVWGQSVIFIISEMWGNVI